MLFTLLTKNWVKRYVKNKQIAEIIIFVLREYLGLAHTAGKIRGPTTRKPIMSELVR